MNTSRAVLAKGSRTFNFASYFLPADRRDDAAVVYAFCRAVDDAGDDATDLESARASLGKLREALDGGDEPTVALFLEVARRRCIDLAHARNLLKGVEGDLESVRISNLNALIRYAYHVAGTVGLMMCGVLGVKHPKALPFAVDLGVAMQLTNIARDVREDARMGRVYLPAQMLEQQGLTPELVLSGQADPLAVRRVVVQLLAVADFYYRSGELGLRYIPWRPRLAILVAARIYRAIGQKILRTGVRFWEQRTVVGGGAKLVVALGAALRFLSPTVLGLSRVPTHAASLHEGLHGLPGTAEPPRLAA